MADAILAQWKDIPNTQEIYQASDSGEIRSKDRVIVKMNRWGFSGDLKKKGRILKPWRDSNGYLVVYVCCHGKQVAINVHRLIAMAFHGIPDGKKDVNHIDGNKQNNEAKNLEWCTRKENMAHARRTGLHDPAAKRPPAHNRKCIVGTPINGGECVYFESSRDASAKVTKNPRGHGNIRSAAAGKLRQAYGYFWKYEIVI